MCSHYYLSKFAFGGYQRFRLKSLNFFSQCSSEAFVPTSLVSRAEAFVHVLIWK